MISVEQDSGQRSRQEPSAKKQNGRDRFHKRLLSTMSQYRTVVVWFWNDAYRRFRGRVLAVLLYSALSLGFLLGALGLVYFYIQALENGQAVAFRGHTIVPRESIELLILIATAAFFLFTLSFAFRFVSRLKALALGRSYEEFCSKRAIALLANHGGHPDAGPWVEKAGQALQSDPRYCGRVARISVGIVLPLLTFFGTFALLISLETTLTLVVLAMMAAALPVLYSINVRGARHSVAMENLARPARQVKSVLVRIPSDGGGLLQPDSPEVEDAFAKGPVARHLNAYVGRLRASDNSEFLTNLMMALGLTVILAIKGVELMNSGEGWSELAAYILALRFNLQSTTQASKTLTSINRFYPQVARHYRFVHSMEGLPPAPAEVNVTPDSPIVDDDLTDE